MKSSQLFSVLLVGLCVIASISRFMLSVEADPDLWWHLTLGLKILLSKSVFIKDVWSFGTANSSWVNHEWLTELLLAIFYSNFGGAGLICLRGLVMCLTIFLFAYLLYEMSESYFLTVLIVLCGSSVFALFSNLRPYLVTWFFVLLLIFIIRCAERGHFRYLYLLPAVFLLWVNMHGGFIFGFLVFSLEAFLIVLRKGEKSLKISIVSVIVLSGCALYVNPYGLGIFEYLFRELSFKNEFVSEWQSMNFEQMSLALVWIAPPIILLTIGRRLPRKISYLILFCGTGALALYHSRFLMLLMISSGLLFMDLAGLLLKSTESSRVGRWKLFLDSKGSLFILLLFIISLSFESLQKDIDAGKLGIVVNGQIYPIAAVEFLKNNTADERIGVPLRWGGYLMWHLGPRQKVSLDGRNVTFYAPSYVHEKMQAYETGDLESFSEAPRADILLVGSQTLMADAISRNPKWVRVFEDGIALIAMRAPYNRLEAGLMKKVDGGSKAWFAFP